MKFAILFSLFIGSLAFAQNENAVSTELAPSQSEKAILAGNYELNGAFNISHARTTIGDHTVINIRPDFGYFIADRLLLGGSLNIFSSNGFSQTGIGPRVSYFFWESGPLATEISQRLFVTNSGNINFISGMTSVGGKYFFNSNVAFGVDLAFDYGLNSEARDVRSTSLNGAFATYF